MQLFLLTNLYGYFLFKNPHEMLKGPWLKLSLLMVPSAKKILAFV